MSDRPRPDELRRQLTTLWRAARTGIDTMREVVVRSSQAGKLRFDIALAQRERAQLLEHLGERTLAFLDELPDSIEVPDDLRQLHERIRDLEGRIRSDRIRAHDNAFGAKRGFEPEAASDYGDEAPDSIIDVDEHPAPEKKPARARRKKAVAKGRRNGV